MIQEDVISTLNREAAQLGEPMGIYSFVGTIRGLDLIVNTGTRLSTIKATPYGNTIYCKPCGGQCERDCDECGRCNTLVNDEYNRGIYGR